MNESLQNKPRDYKIELKRSILDRENIKINPFDTATTLSGSRQTKQSIMTKPQTPKPQYKKKKWIEDTQNSKQSTQAFSNQNSVQN